MKRPLEVVSPASGTLTDIRVVRGRVNLGIFLAPLDNHRQCIPIDGKVTRIVKVRGGSAPAFLRRARHNNRIETYLKTGTGRMIVRQMTGFVFRRIVNLLSEGQSVKQGDPIGGIVLGSRVELEMPVNVRLTVKEGKRVDAGRTVVGYGR